MSVYKEGYLAVRRIQLDSCQIFPDACDYGCKVNKDDSTWNIVKHAIDSYGLKETRQDDGCTIKIVINLMDEWNTKEDEYFLIEYTRYKDKRYLMDGYFEVSQIVDPVAILKYNIIAEIQMDLQSY